MTSLNVPTIQQAYIQGKTILSKAGLESPAFDALLLLEKIFGIGTRSALAIHGNETASEAQLAAYNDLIERRLTQPLQYLLERWTFDEMPLYVGPGVLVPREDTLALVDAAQEALISREHPRILDLCAGTGAVGLALGRRIPDAEVICVELSDEALPYLRRNIEAFGDGRVTLHVADVLEAPRLSQTFDCIVSKDFIYRFLIIKYSFRYFNQSFSKNRMFYVSFSFFSST